MSKAILTVTLNPAIDMTVDCNTIHLGSLNIANEGHMNAAGKGINAARVLKDLGSHVEVGGILGHANKQLFEEYFAAHNIENHFTYIDGETRINIKLAESSQRVTEINMPGMAISTANFNRFMIRLLQLTDHIDWCVLAGSLPVGLPSDVYALLIKELHSKGVKVVVDTSGDAFAHAVQASPEVIKPNIHELEQWAGRSIRTLDEEVEVVRQLQKLKIKHIVISDGERGSRWYHDQKCWHATPPKIQVVSTVGAGDSMVAAIAHGLQKEWSISHTLSLATAVSAKAVTQVGVGFDSLEDLHYLKAETVVRSHNFVEEASQ